MTTFKDLVGTLLVVAFLPLWMIVGLGALIVIVARQLLWLARGTVPAADVLG